MTRYTGNEPIEPFHVISASLKHRSTGSNVSRGAVPANPQRVSPAPKPPSISPFEGFHGTHGRALAGFLFVPALLLPQFRPMFSAIAVLLLLGCVLYRLNTRRRRIAAAPMILSSTILISQIGAGDANYLRSGIYSLPLCSMWNGIVGWLPLFLAACLFFAPEFSTYSEKIMMGISLLVLGSGLLPSRGFVAIFVATQYFLFIAVAVGLGLDFKEHWNGLTTQTGSAQK